MMAALDRASVKSSEKRNRIGMAFKRLSSTPPVTASVIDLAVAGLLNGATQVATLAFAGEPIEAP